MPKNKTFTWIVYSILALLFGSLIFLEKTNRWTDAEEKCAAELKQSQVMSGKYVALYGNRLEACRNSIKEENKDE